MLVAAFTIFTVVAVLGAVQALDILGGRYASWSYTLAHGALAVLGAAVVIGAYLAGDPRVITLIGMVVVIAPVGFYMALQRRHGRQAPRALLYAHGGLAVVCYLLLGYYALTAAAS